MAWGSVGAVVVLSALTVVLAASNGASDMAYRLPAETVRTLTYPLVGAVIATRRPKNLVGWIFCGVGLTHALARFSLEYATYGVETRPGSLAGAGIAGWFSDWLWFPAYAAIATFLLLLFPDGRLPSRRWRPVAWAALASVGLMFAAALTTLDLQAGRTTVGAPRQGEELAELLGGAAFLSLPVIAALSALSLVSRWRKSRGTERQQIQVFALAGILGVVLLLASNLLEGPAYSAVLTIGILLLPVGAGVSVLKYRLYDVEFVLNRSLVYGLLSSLVVIGYVLIVGAVERLFDLTGIGATLPATAVVAVAFQPLRQRLQHGVDRLMYGQRDDPYGVVAALGRGLEGVAAPEDLLPAATGTIAGALRLPYVCIELVGDGDYRRVASSGQPSGAVEQWPLVHQGETIGRLTVSARAGERLAPADRRILADLARQTSVAAHAVMLTEDVRRSRERLRIVLEDERRRIRRDLHDGLGPSLATVVVGIEEARNTYRRDAHAGDAVLEGVKRQTQDAITDIRSLVYDLRPPALDQLGLVVAIREQAARLAGRTDSPAALTITVEASDELPPLPAAVEVACFRIVQEAITNVVRHAHASHCAVQISMADQELIASVEDNGRGIAELSRPGVGLTSMRERASELGADLQVQSSPHGTGITVRFSIDTP